MDLLIFKIWKINLEPREIYMPASTLTKDDVHRRFEQLAADPMAFSARVARVKALVESTYMPDTDHIVIDGVTAEKSTPTRLGKFFGGAVNWTAKIDQPKMLLTIQGGTPTQGPSVAGVKEALAQQLAQLDELGLRP
jgi:hypothetical protein